MTIQIFEKKEKIFHAFKMINNRLLLLRFVIAQTIQSDFGHPKRSHERPIVFQGGSNTYKGHWNTEPTGPRTFLLYLSAFNMYRLNINSHTTLTLDCGIGSRDFKNHIRIGSRYIKNHNPDPDISKIRIRIQRPKIQLSTIRIWYFKLCICINVYQMSKLACIF